MERRHAIEQQRERMDAELLGEAFHRPQGEVPLPTFDRTHERPVPPDVFAERLLRVPHLTTKSPNVVAHDVLEFTFHAAHP